LKTIITRTISGLVFLILIIGSIFLGPFAFGFVFLIFLVIGMMEFLKITKIAGYSPAVIPVIVAGTLFYSLVLLNIWNYITPQWIILSVPFIFLIILFELYRKSKTPTQNIGLGLLAIVYVAVPFALMNLFFYPEMDTSIPVKGLLLGFFIIIWVNDTFAYLTGMAIGKHKLFERISPNKTIEGSLGGFIFGLISSYVLSLIFDELSLYEWLGLAVVIIIFGTFGDLVESMFKRSTNIKDSGNIMPGHGGILDRFDSVLMASPFVFIYIMIVLK